MKVPHSHFAKVTRMVFVDVCAVMVLATCHTTTTRVLSVLAYTTMARGDMAATGNKKVSAMLQLHAGPATEIGMYAVIRLTVFSSSSGE